MLDSKSSAEQIRQACRSDSWRETTAGLAAGYVQANLVILPADAAADFQLFCQRNPRPCPLIEVLEAGRSEPRCARGADLRRDLPGYRIYRDGTLAAETVAIVNEWRDDLVSFLIGCSFTFEAALVSEGIALRHLTLKRNVAMFRTNQACRPAGRFQGNLVVSMRPIKEREVARAVAISARFPDMHGAPVHIGAPELLGIGDLSRPDYGEAVPIESDEVPVFWACGVTPQAVIESIRLPLCITHAPGKMFVTDLREER